MSQHVAMHSPELPPAVNGAPKPTSDAPPPSDGAHTSGHWSRGWQPGDDEHTEKAVAWRAATALRRSNRALFIVGKLDASVNSLDATLRASNEAWAKRWTTVSRLAWGVGVPVLVTITLAALAFVGRWLSTLHH